MYLASSVSVSFSRNVFRRSLSFSPRNNTSFWSANAVRKVSRTGVIFFLTSSLTSSALKRFSKTTYDFAKGTPLSARSTISVSPGRRRRRVGFTYNLAACFTLRTSFCCSNRSAAFGSTNQFAVPITKCKGYESAGYERPLSPHDFLLSREHMDRSPPLYQLDGRLPATAALSKRASLKPALASCFSTMGSALSAYGFLNFQLDLILVPFFLVRCTVTPCRHPGGSSCPKLRTTSV